MDLLSIQKDDLSTLEQSKYARVAGVILAIKEIKTRSGKYMAFIEIDDSTAAAEIVVFPAIWNKIKDNEFKETDIIICSVKVEETNPDIKLILNKIKRIETDEMDT